MLSSRVRLMSQARFRMGGVEQQCSPRPYLMANHKLAKAIADMGFYEFRRQLDYKTKLYGSKLVIVDRWFPSSKICSKCGHKKETLSLSERVFHCDHCNFETDRDLNAAINLSQYVSAS